MKLVIKLVSATIFSLLLMTAQASDETTHNTPGYSLNNENPFDWFSTFSGSAPQESVTMEFHPIKPDSWASMIAPQSHMQWHMAMTNPANYSQYMQPAFYMEFMNPNNWMAWMNPASYQVFMDPQTMTWWMNPNTYMHMLNPNMFAQMWNFNSYAKLIAPENYMSWMNPATYANFMNPEMYMAYTDAESASGAGQTNQDEAPAE